MKKNILPKILIVALLSIILLLPSCKWTERKTAQVYMLAPDPDTLMNSFVIKTHNDKIIVIDGGGKTNYGSYMPYAIRAILGLAENDYFEIEAWFITHYHNDHHYELAKVLNEYNNSTNFDIIKVSQKIVL